MSEISLPFEIQSSFVLPDRPSSRCQGNLVTKKVNERCPQKAAYSINGTHYCKTHAGIAALQTLLDMQ